MHNRKQQKNSSKNCSFLFNEITRRTSFSLSKILRRIYNFSLKITRKIHNFLIWSLHRRLNRIEMTWKIIIIVIFSSDRFELIDLSVKIVAKRHVDDCFWIFSLNDFISIESCLLRFRWYYDQNFLWTRRIVDILLLCSERRSLRERFNRVELLQNKCFQKHFRNALRRRNWRFFTLIFIEIFLICDERCLYNDSFCCICTLVEKTTKFFLFLRLHILKENEHERQFVKCMIFVRIHYNV